ncbi:MAG: NosD domain-containing protein [Candidatus Bathyarchaeia archaeon]
MNTFEAVFLLIIILAPLCLTNVALSKPQSERIIYIRVDGRVDGTDKIQRIGDVYTLTANLDGSIVIERDDMVIDGASYTIHGAGNGKGIDLSGIRKNVTIKNFNIKYFHVGIYIDGPYTGALGEEGGHTISGNNLTKNKYGIWLKNSPDNVFRNNRMADNEYNLVVEPTWSTFYSRQHIDPSNTVDGKPVYYWVNKQDVTVPANAGYVALIGCSRIKVKQLCLSNNKQGILLVHTTESIIANNTLTNNGVGVCLSDSSSNNIIFENNVANNDYGILVVVSPFNTLRDNKMIGNKQNLCVYSAYLEGFIQHIDSTNTVNGKPVYYFVEKQNKTVPSDAGYIALIKCISITIQNLNLTDNGQGIILASTINSTITRTTIKNKDVGIYLWNSSNNIISENIIANNEKGISLYGIYPYHPNNNEIRRNLISSNGIGIQIMNSPNNKIHENNIENNKNALYIILGEGSKNNFIYRNNFINNTAEAPGTWHVVVLHEVWLPPLPNSWDDGKEGNYWSDYITRYPDAKEKDGLGIWNKPYIISENNRDNYPLVNPIIVEHQDENKIEFPNETDNALKLLTEKSFSTIVLVATIVVTFIIGFSLFIRSKRREKYLRGLSMKKPFVVLFVFLFAMSSITIFSTVKAESRTIVVPDDYATISLAIDKAAPGDMIFIKKGIHDGPINQTIIINKKLSIVGEKAENTVLKLYPAYNVTWILTTPFFDYSDAISINANSCRILNLTIIIANPGGYISVIGDRTRIVGNNITTGSTTGIRINGSYSLLTDNAIVGTIKLNGHFNEVARNSFYSVSIAGSLNAIKNNTCHSIGLFNSTNNAISSNNVTTTTRSYCGIYLSASDNNLICRNHVSGFSYGCTLWSSSSNIIAANTIADSQVASINLYNSFNNTFYLNNLIDNMWDWIPYVYDYYADPWIREGDPTIKISTNLWDNGSVGNHWRGYNGTDTNGDGIGDLPHIIKIAKRYFDSSSEEIVYGRDNFPLMAPVNIENVSIELPEWALTLLLERKDMESTAPSPESSIAPQEPYPQPLASTIVLVIITVTIIVFATLLFYLKKYYKGKSMLKKTLMFAAHLDGVC